MPGKVNPVVIEAAIQAGLKVMADDILVAEAVSRGTMQINEFMPLLADALLGSLELLLRTNAMLARHVPGIRADEARCRAYAESSPSLITAFLPHIGYEKATQMIKDFGETKEKSFRAFMEQKLGKELVDRILSPHNITSLGYRDDEKNA
jgi:aspartate ammonia-lyase